MIEGAFSVIPVAISLTIFTPVDRKFPRFFPKIAMIFLINSAIFGIASGKPDSSPSMMLKTALMPTSKSSGASSMNALPSSLINSPISFSKSGIASIRARDKDFTESKKTGITSLSSPGISFTMVGTSLPTSFTALVRLRFTAGRRFLKAVSALDTTLSNSFPMSAFGSASPVIRFSHAAFMADIEPEIVFSASSAVVPVTPISV